MEPRTNALMVAVDTETENAGLDTGSERQRACPMVCDSLARGRWRSAVSRLVRYITVGSIRELAHALVSTIRTFLNVLGDDELRRETARERRQN